MHIDSGYLVVVVLIETESNLSMVRDLRHPYTNVLGEVSWAYTLLLRLFAMVMVVVGDVCTKYHAPQLIRCTDIWL